MTKIFAVGGFVASGKLMSFDEGSDVIRFQFSNGVELEIKNPNPKMIASISQIGLHRLADAEIDFIKNTISLLPTSGDAKMMHNNNSGISVPMGFSR